MIPLLRFTIFVLCTCLFLVNLYSFDILGRNKFITPDGFVVKDENYSIHYFIDVSLSVFRLVCNILVMIKLIQYPSDDIVEEEVGESQKDHIYQIIENNSYVWDTFHAFALMVLGTTNSNDLILDLFSKNLFTSIHDIEMDGNVQILGNVTTDMIHNFFRTLFLITKIFFTFQGLVYFIINMSKPGTFQFKNPGMRGIIMFFFEIVVFTTGFVTTIMFAIELNPHSIQKKHIKFKNSEFLETRKLEFSFEILNELILITACHVLVFFHYFYPEKKYENENKKKSYKNAIVFSFPFRAIVIGYYTSVSSSWQILAFKYVGLYSDLNVAQILSPFLIYLISLVFVSTSTIVIIVENGYEGMSIIQKETVSFVKQVGMKIGHNRPKIILWKIGIVFGLTSLLIIILCMNTGWYEIKIKPGTVPKAVSHVIEDLASEIETVGHDAFEALKKLDPCRWDPSKGDDQPTSVVGTTKNTGNWSFSLVDESGQPIQGTEYTSRLDMKHYSLNNFNDFGSNQEHCKSSGATCSNLAKHTQHLQNVRQKFERHKNSDVLSDLYNHGDFKTFNDSDVEYQRTLNECHNNWCEAVFTTAVAFEAVMTASDMLGWLPLIGEEEETAVEWTVWFGQITNRAGHGVVKFGKTVYWFVRKLKDTLSFIEPMFKRVVKLVTLTEKYVVAPDVSSFIVYIPTILFGGVSFLLGFWKRENTKTAMKDLDNLVMFFLPLLLANVMMIVLMFVFPYIITELLKAMPEALLQVFFDMKHSLRLVRVSFILSSLGVTFMIGSLILDVYEKLLPKFRRAKRGLRSVFSKINPFGGRKVRTSGYRMGTNVLVENGGLVEKWIDVDWLQSFIINIPVVILMIIIVRDNLEFVQFTFKPTGDMIKIVQGFESHAHLLAHSKRTTDDFDAFTCGIVGKAIEEVISFAVNLLKDSVTAVADKLESFVESISVFQSLLNTIEHVGHFLIDALGDTWHLAEKALVMVVPLLNTLLFLIGSVLQGRKNYLQKNQRSEESEDIGMIVDVIYRTITVLAVYNITLILMVQQTFATIKHINLFLFVFEAKVGILSTYALISSGLNLLGVLSLYISSMYKLK